MHCGRVALMEATGGTTGGRRQHLHTHTYTHSEDAVACNNYAAHRLNSIVIQINTPTEIPE